jgi:hypothetical protein
MPIMKREENNDMGVDAGQNYLKTNETKVGLLLLGSEMHTSTFNTIIMLPLLCSIQ